MSSIGETVSPREKIRLLQENWREETVVARIYHDLAKQEANPKRRELLTKMAISEEEHAALWAERLVELGVTVNSADAEGEYRKQHRLIGMLGVNGMIRRIERDERGHVADYQAQIKQLNDPVCTAILERVIPDEKDHAARLQAMGAAGTDGPARSRLDAMLAGEKWHARSTGSWIGDAIYGVNDGLGAVFGIVSGVAGATQAEPRIVLLAGLAGMVASAFSMGSGAYLAAKSEREVHEAEIAREKREIETDPEHEREEMELMFQLKGFSEDESKMLADRLTASPEQFLQTMVAEELGLSEERLPSPWTSALVATVSTAVGAFLPVIPFFYSAGNNAVLQSLVISIVAHFAVGASKTLITGRSWLSQGLEMTVVGMLGGALAYGFGKLFEAWTGVHTAP
ncbi:MAG: VIT1/CCC1 transporter family protein [Fibrella sp.]|nr:VIT1/CCC1 transporter family protein [Armatimonadota bacterium]